MRIIVEAEGPRSIEHSAFIDSEGWWHEHFTSRCSDCGWTLRVGHRLDAQNALDKHEC